MSLLCAGTDTDVQQVSSWIQGYSADELRGAQLQDRDLALLIKYMETKIEPEQHVLYLQSQAFKHWWLNRGQLDLKSGVLYYRWEDVLGSGFFWFRVVSRRCYISRMMEDHPDILRLIRLCMH